MRPHVSEPLPELAARLAELEAFRTALGKPALVAVAANSKKPPGGADWPRLSDVQADEHVARGGNVAAVLGDSAPELVCLDVDASQPFPGFERERFEGWPIVDSATPGRFHVYMLRAGFPSDLRHLSALAESENGRVELRCGRHYNVAPGSVFGGRAYRFHPGSLQRPPAWLVELTRSKLAGDRKPRPTIEVPLNGQGDGGPPRARTALERETANVLTAPPGQRHDQLVRSTSALASLVPNGELSESEVRCAMESCARTGQPDQLGEAMRAIEDGIRFGLAHPRSDQPRLDTRPQAQGAATLARPPTSAAAAPSVPPPLEWFSPDQLPERDPDADIVRDFIGRGEFAALAGASQSGKSFLAIELCVAIAGDRSKFLDLPVQHHGLVLYMAAEGVSGLGARVRAADPDERASARLRVAKEVPMLLDRKSVERTIVSVRRIIAGAFKGEAPLLLVLDTFAQATAGADENDNGEMGEAVRALLSFVQELGCAVLILHHPKKKQALGESFLRGASSLLCALDAAWGIEKVKGEELVRIVTTEKQKDRPSDGAWRVEFERVGVGKSSTLRVASAKALASAFKERLDREKAAVQRSLRRDAILAALYSVESRGLCPRDLRERLICRGVNLSAKTLERDVDQLRAADLVQKKGLAQAARVWLTEKGQAVTAKLLADEGAGLACDPLSRRLDLAGHAGPDSAAPQVTKSAPAPLASRDTSRDKPKLKNPGPARRKTGRDTRSRHGSHRNGLVGHGTDTPSLSGEGVRVQTPTHHEPLPDLARAAQGTSPDAEANSGDT